MSQTINPKNADVAADAKITVQEVILQSGKQYNSFDGLGRLIASTAVNDQYITVSVYKPGSTNPSTFTRIERATGFLEFTDFSAGCPA